MKSKICTNCGIEKKLSEFTKLKISKDKYAYWCKECDKNRHKISYLNNKDIHKKRGKKYRNSNKEKLKEYSKSYRKKNKNQINEYRLNNLDKLKNLSLKRNFGITLEEYNKMLEQQNGVCAICREKESLIDKRSNKLRKLSVDHCHHTNKIRDLLCLRCNSILGYSKDNINLLTNAINYLNKYKE